MQQKISTSIISGGALLAFTILSCSLYFFNLKLATELMSFLFPVGAVLVAFGLVVIVTQRLRPNAELRSPKQLLPLLALMGSLAALASGFIWMVMPALFTMVVPVLVLLAQAATCEFLIRAKISRTCTLLLIASVILEITTWWAADRIGTEKGADSARFLTDPVILTWVICHITATFSIGRGPKSTPNESEEKIEATTQVATYLWAAGAMVWMISLVFIEGASQMSMP